jgi:hypothetical protein
MKKKKKADPMRTRTGKPRLGPLNLAQLEEMFAKAQKKEKNKIQNRINELRARNKVVETVVSDLNKE